jgi:hypothetical protein
VTIFSTVHFCYCTLKLVKNTFFTRRFTKRLYFYMCFKMYYVCSLDYQEYSVYSTQQCFAYCCATRSNLTASRNNSIAAGSCRQNWVVPSGTAVMITVGRGWVKLRLEFLVLFEPSVQDVNVCIAIMIV